MQVAQNNVDDSQLLADALPNLTKRTGAETMACPLRERCPAQPGKRDERHHLRFTQAEARAAERRRMSQEHAQDRHSLRSAVES